MFMWGHNNYGQLGLDDTENKATPQQMMALAGKHIINTTLGCFRSIALIK